jgi:hypothetical protein
MAMSKPEFELLAAVIAKHNNDCAFSPDVFTDVQLQTIAAFCKANNPRFNEEKWMKVIRGEA